MTRRYHKLFGMLLILPMLGWVLTGAVFMLKPGYDDAFALLPVKTYPINAPLTIAPDASWREMKLIQTVLGQHLLIAMEESRVHLHPDTLADYVRPSDEDLMRLIDDATSHNRHRYGQIEGISNGIAHTSSGIEISVNWQSLSLHQKGKDTRLINQLYKVHYLQWTPSELLNKLLAVLGLGLLLGLTVLGIRLIIKK
ncbi:MAG: hypothetical protein AB8B48_18490 [Pseudomonadales bacterium]